MVEIDEFAVSGCIFVSFANNADIVVHYVIMTTIGSGFLPTPIRKTFNYLECPIHLKVRLSQGMLAINIRYCRSYDIGLPKPLSLYYFLCDDTQSELCYSI